jgi:hypothetical protein
LSNANLVWTLHYSERPGRSEAAKRFDSSD